MFRWTAEKYMSIDMAVCTPNGCSHLAVAKLVQLLGLLHYLYPFLSWSVMTQLASHLRTSPQLGTTHQCQALQGEVPKEEWKEVMLALRRVTRDPMMVA